MTTPARTAWLALATVLAASLLVAIGAQAQPSIETSATTAIPDDVARSGRFINLTRGLSSLGEAGTHLSMTVPASQSTFTLELFDGDMGGKWDPRSPATATPDLVSFTLYADPAASNANSILVGQWLSSSMPDDDWFTATIAQSPDALGTDGNYHYNLVVKWVTTALGNEQNNFKIRVEGLVYLLANSTYGFIGYGPNDPSPAQFPPTSYDGTWRFMVNVPSDARAVDFWDGDFDRANDTDDPLSPAFPPFPYAPTTVSEGAHNGAPADDADPLSPLRIDPPIRVVIAAPDGQWTVSKDDPSGDKEWELFRVTTDPLDLTAHALVPSIPAGLYEWRVEGADGRNTLFITPQMDLYPELCSIGDRVWNDADMNGVQDPDESGVPNVPVAVFRDGDTVALDTTVTDGDGYYRFGNLPPGFYRVQFTTPSGWALTNPDQGGDDQTDSDASLADGSTVQTELVPNEDDLSWDAGLYKLASLGDYAWYDTNLDGIQDTDELPVPGVTVTLFTSDGTVAGTAVTDETGHYQFAGLVPGAYFLTFAPPAGAAITLAGQGSDPELDCDADPETGVTPQTTLVAGENDMSWDLGLVQLASVGDRVWYDINADGLQGDGETGVAGVTVTLYKADGTEVDRTTTDADGIYAFADLRPGDHYIVFDPVAGRAFSPQDQGSDDALDSDVSPDDGKTATFTLAPGAHDTTRDAGVFQPASIGDLVWEDLNANGVQDAGETGLPGVMVTLLTADRTDVGQAVTDGAGWYEFAGLRPGDYLVVFTLPGGLTWSPADQGSDDAVDSDVDAAGETIITTLDPGENDPTWDGGAYRLASVGDLVWDDLNGNGQQDAGEPGLPGVTVTLYDADGNPVGASAVTDADGWYQFTDLMPGHYYVVFGTLPGYAFTTQDQGDDASDSDANPADGRGATFELTSGEEDLTWDAGMVRLGSIGDLVWSDANADGVQQSGEPGLEGVTVTLYAADGTEVATATTDANGLYLFADLKPGDYYVAFGGKPGYSLTQQDQGDDAADSDPSPGDGETALISLAPGENDLTWDAGLVQLASVGDFVWHDANRNGIQDSGEAGIGGVTVGLYTADGDLVGTQTTAGDGSYSFTGLMPGAYYLQFGGKSGYALTLADQGADNGADSDASVGTGETATFSLAAGANDITWDAGLYASCSIKVIKTGAKVAGNCKTIGFWKANITKHLSSSAECPNGTQVSKTKLKQWLQAVDAFYHTDIIDLGPDGASLTTLMTNAKAILCYTGSDMAEKTKRQLLACELNALSGTYAMDDAATHIAFCQTVEDALKSGDVDLAPLHDQCDQINNLGEGSSSSELYVGDSMVFTITVTADLSQVTRYEVRDYLDSGLTFVSASGGGSYVASGHYVKWLVDLPTGASTTRLQVWVKIRALPSDDSNDNPGPGWSFSPWYSVTVYSCDDSSSGGGDCAPARCSDGGDDPPTCTSKTLRNRVTWRKGGEPLTGSIGDVVWNDTTLNGVQDAGEAGVAGVTVALYDAAGNQLATKTTDAAGKYLFSGLQPGDYTVGFTAPAGWALVAADQGSDDARDSDANLTTGKTATIALNAGENDLTWDAGLTQLASIGNLVWADTNADGLQTASETGLAGVTVSLYSADGALVANATTGGDGSYLFGSLAPGDYYLVFGGKDGYKLTTANQGGNDALDSDAATADGRTIVTHLDAGETDLTWDAGLVVAPSGTITVQKSGGKFRGGCMSPGFWKTNIEKHLCSTSERPSGTQVTKTQLLSWLRAVDAYYHLDVIDLGSSSANLTTLLSAAKTIMNYSGSSAVGKLERELLASELNLASCTYAMADTAAHAALVRSAEDALKAGSTDLGTLHDLLSAANVLGDCTSSSKLYAGDQVLFTLTVTSDLAAASTVELRDYLDRALSFLGATGGGSYVSSGRYAQWTLNLPAGQGVVTTVQLWAKVTGTPGAADDPSGDWVASNTISLQVYSTSSYSSSPAAGADRCTTGGSGTLYNTAYARIVQSSGGGCIGDTVWNDTDADGCQDDDEVGCSGVKVRLKTSSGNTVCSTTTDGKGRFSFRNLSPGSYLVVVTAPSGCVQTYDATPPLDDCSAVTLAAGRNHTGTGFGYMQAPTQLVTYSQSDWGKSPSRSAAAALLADSFGEVYTGGVTIGDGKKLRFTSAGAVRGFLPTTGRADSLRYSATDPTDDSGAGVLAGEVLALQLNVDFSRAGLLPAGLGYVKVTGGSFAGWKVADVLALANAVLGGDDSGLPQGVSKRDLANALAAINAGNSGGGTW